MSDTVNHPSHYNAHPSGVECIDIVECYNFNIGNAIKYLWRAGLKSPDAIEDLKKAAWYCMREVDRLQTFVNENTKQEDIHGKKYYMYYDGNAWVVTNNFADTSNSVSAFVIDDETYKNYLDERGLNK